MNDVAADLRYPIPALRAKAIAGAGTGVNVNGSPQTANCSADTDPALEALRQAQVRRSAQSRRRHARMDRELEELSSSEN